MKKILYFATAALALSACSSDDFLGEDRPNLGGAEELAISLDGGTGVLTRAAKTGSEAATALGNNFVVYGWKTPGAGTNPRQVVYDHYNVNWGGAAGSTTSNTAGWEYVNQDLNMLTSLTKTDNKQEIKYWDFAATQYDFIAFSTGLATQVEAESDIATGKVYVTAIAPTSTPVSPDTYTGPKYTIKGATADLAKCYIADRVTAANNASPKIDNRYVAYKDAIQFNFRSLSSKVRLAIYETIPGYSVKDVTFYKAEDTTTPSATAPTLFAAAANIPGGTGTMTVTFPTTDKAETDYNKAHVAFTGGTNTQDLTFSALQYTTREKLEESTGTAEIFLGRTSATATYAGNKTATDHAYVTVLPAVVGTLTLKVDYTLVSKDGNGEEINVKGATAVVPAEYCTWQPNYAYTYIFKISDKTNGQIGTEPAGLYPITFDAIVTETEDGVQETITEVTTPSITTYQAGKVVTVNNEYTAGSIYVAVEGTPALTEGTNYNLYTATVETGALQGITEASVENCLLNAKTYTAVTAGTNLAVGTTYYTSNKGAGKFTVTAENASSYEDVAADTYYTAAAATGPWTVYDAAGKALTLTLANDAIAPATAIPAGDSPTGDELSINCAVITASASTVYVFEYINSGVKTYKVIKVQ